MTELPQVVLNQDVMHDVALAGNMVHKSSAEREGFEPSVPLRVQRFSRPPRSTTPAPLQSCTLTIRSIGSNGKGLTTAPWVM